MSYINPNKLTHQYIIGIDFGHGETSADICNIQWDDNFQALTTPEPIEIFNGVSAIKSVLLVEITQNQKKRYIGQQAINRYLKPSTTSKPEKLSYHACFKKKPSAMNEEEKEVMADFMAEVYAQIRRQRAELKDNNHVVYLACPSNSEEWSESEIVDYAKIALAAGLPLAQTPGHGVGIIRESRAAFIKARANPSTKSSVKEGILLIDFGSSTVDLTYYSSDFTSKPIDHGSDTCGASNVEALISSDLCERNLKLKQATQNSETAQTALSLTIRDAKEDFYTYDGEDMECCVSLTKITAGSIKGSVEEYLTKENIDNILIDYYSAIKACFKEFRDTYIADYPIKLIYMTGGASRMGFIQDIAREVFNYQGDFYRETNPSLTISNGIALAGRADMRTLAMEGELGESPILNNADIATTTKERASIIITDEIMHKLAGVYSDFADSSKDDSISSLERKIEQTIHSINFSSFIKQAYNEELREISNKQIMPKINDIISDYFPEFKVPYIESKATFPLQVIVNNISTLSSIISASLSSITEGFMESLGKHAWNIAFGAFYGVEGMLINGVIWSINQFRDNNKQIEYIDLDEFVSNFTIGFRNKNTNLSSARRADVKKVFDENKSTYHTKICNEVRNILNADSDLKSSINLRGRNEIKEYIKTQIAKARLMLN